MILDKFDIGILRDNDKFNNFLASFVLKLDDFASLHEDSFDHLRELIFGRVMSFINQGDTEREILEYSFV